MIRLFISISLRSSCHFVVVVVLYFRSTSMLPHFIDSQGFALCISQGSHLSALRVAVCEELCLLLSQSRGDEKCRSLCQSLVINSFNVAAGI